MSKEKILITGANGFIGKNLIETALDKNLEVYCAVRAGSNTKTIEGLNVTILTFNYQDTQAMSQQFISHRFDYIIHNAGLTKSPDPQAYLAANKEVLVQLVTALRLSGIKYKKFVFVSSMASYGPADFQKEGIVRNDSKPHPVTHYGVSKLAAEQFLSAQTDVPYMIIRPTAVYGPGEKDLFNVFKMIQKHIDIQPGLVVPKLTFIYVEDLAELILLAALNEKSQRSYFATDGHVYTGDAFSGFIKESLQKWVLQIKVPIFIIKAMAFLSEKWGQSRGEYPILNLDKVHEIKARSWVCDVSNLYKDLGFVAKHDLRSGIQKTVHWYKQHNWL